MFAVMRVFGRVTVWRAIAAQGSAAGLAGTEVNPFRADLHTLCAFANVGMFHRRNR